MPLVFIRYSLKTEGYFSLFFVSINKPAPRFEPTTCQQPEHSFQAKPPTTRKYELIGEDPELFRAIDEKVRDVSQKWYKSLKRIVRILENYIQETPAYDNVEDLVKVRAFWLWTAENIR